MAPPSINTQVTITASNKWLDLWDAVGGNQSVALTEQTYDDMPAVCAALQVLVQALGGTWVAATVDVVFDQSIPGKVRIHSNQAINATSILWNTGAHGSGFLDTHCGDVLGFADAADDAGAYYYNSDYQHMYGWYATRAVRTHGPLLLDAIGGPLRKVLSRKYAKKVHIGYEGKYEFVVESIPAAEMIYYKATGANTNRALGWVLEQMLAGEWFRFREDQETLATYSDFYVEEPNGQFGNTPRRYPDYEAYDFRMVWNYKQT